MSSLRTTPHKDQRPAPGHLCHDHHAGPRPPEVPPALWAAYGDRYPGSACRWLDGEFNRLVGIVQRDAAASCELCRCAARWRLADAHEACRMGGYAAGIRVLDELLADFELLACSPSRLEVTA